MSRQTSAPKARTNPIPGYLEAGAAVAELAAQAAGAKVMAKANDPAAATKPQRIKVVVVGAGQAGLSVGYHLRRLGVPFVILEAHDRIGQSWRDRWTSLRLFTPARFDGLDGMRFPAPPRSFPTKDAMAAYLEVYARRFGLPVRTGVKVDRVARRGAGYVVTAGSQAFEADHVVVAMASYQEPRRPAFAGDLDPSIIQLHSSAYRDPSQLRDGGVLIVGAGNSGSEIAMELARSHQICMSGRDTGHVPFRLDSFWGRNLLAPLVLRVVFHRLLTTGTIMGRKARPKVIAQGGPLIRVKPQDLAAAGVKRAGRTLGVRDGKPMLEDGRVLDVANVIWCTGFHPDVSWIDLPVFGAGGEPRQQRGVVEGEPGLYFIGLHFLYAFSSTMIHGVGRDARYLAATIARRARVARR